MNRQPRKCLFDPVCLVAGHDGDRRSTACERGFYGAPDERPAVHIGQKLVLAHPRGEASSQNHGGNFWRERGVGGSFFARLRTACDFGEQPAHAHACDLARRDGQVGTKPPQHEIESVELRRTRATGQTDNGRATELSDEQQIARIDGHAEMHDFTSRPRDGGWNDIFAVGNCTRAEDEDGISIFICCFGAALRQVRFDFMFGAALRRRYPN